MKKAYGTPKIRIITTLLEYRKRNKGAESLFKEIMAENFQNLRKDTDIQLHEAQRFLISFNSKTSPRYIITDCQQLKTENLESNREKKLITHEGKPISRSPKRNLTGQERVG